MQKEVQELYEILQTKQQLIQIISTEYERIDALILNAYKKDSNDNRPIFKWNLIEKIQEFDWEKKNFVSKEDSNEYTPSDILEWYQNEAKDCILILEDFYPYLENNPQNIRIMRNIARLRVNKNLILSQPFMNLPIELEKDTHIIQLDLPSKDDLEVIFNEVCKQYAIECDDFDKIISAALGLTIMQARKVFAQSIVRNRENNKKLGEDEVQLIISEKEKIIKNSGFLEYYHHQENLDDVGGLENLKDWLKKRGRAYQKGAKEFGLEYPKGVLLLGIAGTGKSLCAKAIGNEWQFPIIKLDMGKIYGGIVGESENNIRKALQIAEALSPSVLWIDEIEKGLSGMSSSSSSDGGTTARVLGTFLTWMQEKKKPVFVVATANDISQLPPELLRKGRIDEIFFVDLPAQKAREEIITIHLKKFKRDVTQFDRVRLAQESKGFSGAEIEECIKEALFQAYDEAKEVSDSHIIEAIQKTYPLSKTMGEMIQNMRKWAKARAVLASKEEYDGELESKATDTIPKLKQETLANPFI